MGRVYRRFRIRTALQMPPATFWTKIPRPRPCRPLRQCMADLLSHYVTTKYGTICMPHPKKRFAKHCNVLSLALSPPIPLRLYTLPYWPNPPFLIFDIRALWRSVLSAKAPECQKLKNGGLDQYGAEPVEQQQFVTVGVEGVKEASPSNPQQELRGTVVKRQSFAGELSLSCGRLAADGWPLIWVNHLLQVNQPGQLSLSSCRAR